MLIKGSVYKRVSFFSPICLAIAACVLLLGCAGMSATTGQTPEESMPASIDAIKVSSSGGERTVVEMINSKHAPYTTFKLIDPPRVIVDIRGVPGSDLPRLIPVNDGNVTEIHLEKGKAQAMTTRIVVGMAKEGDYNIDEKDNIIVLTLKQETRPAGKQKAALPAESGLTEAASQETADPRIFFKPGSRKLNRVLGVDFAMLNRGKSRLTVTTSRKVSYNLERKGPKTLVLVLDGVSTPSLLLRRLDSSQFEGAVDRVKPDFSPADNRLSLAISLKEMVPLHVDQTDNDIHIDFGQSAARRPAKKIIPVKLVQAQVKSPAKGLTLTGPAQTGAIPGIGRGKYRGPNMTMDFSNAEVTNVLRLIGEVSNLNVIWGPDVKGKVSMRLKNVPWEQALDLILANNNLGKREEGNIIWITTKAKIVQIEQEEARKVKAAEAAIRRQEKEQEEKKQKAKKEEPLITEYLRVDFADAGSDIMPHLDKIKSERGTISVDARTNTIIMTDTAKSIEEAKRIRDEFDTPVKQIMIEARIVDATTNMGRDLGVQWNSITGQRKKRTGVAYGLPPNPTGFAAGGDRLWGGSISSNSPASWAANLGVAFGYLTSSGLGALALDASLALAETEGKLKVISAPRVIASNGEAATISRGDTFYLAAAENVEPKEVEAKLMLTVTPTVSFNNFVSMDISLTDEQVTATGKSGKDLNTKLMVKSGDTVVIGGIYTETKQEDVSGLPWLKDVPILGWLFSAKHVTDNRTELLIFITPRVLPPPGNAS